MAWGDYNQRPQPTQNINPGWGSQLPPRPQTMYGGWGRLSGGTMPPGATGQYNPAFGTGGAMVPSPTPTAPAGGMPGTGYTAGFGSQSGTGMPGTGMPGGGDFMGQMQKFMGQINSSGTTPAPFQPPPSSNGAQQYLMQIKDLMSKLGQGGLPGLPPEVQQMLAQQKAAQTGEINRGYGQEMGSAIASGYGAGMENSSLARNQAADVSGRKAQAISQMLSNLSGQEFGIRSQIGQQQQQGTMGQIGALQQMAQLADQQDQQKYQNALQQYNTNLSSQEHGQDRQMQMMSFFGQMFPQLQRYGGM